jgi:hypothetical protein
MRGVSQRWKLLCRAADGVGLTTTSRACGDKATIAACLSQSRRLFRQDPRDPSLANPSELFTNPQRLFIRRGELPFAMRQPLDAYLHTFDVCNTDGVRDMLRLSTTNDVNVMRRESRDCFWHGIWRHDSVLYLVGVRFFYPLRHSNLLQIGRKTSCTVLTGCLRFDPLPTR